MLTRVKQPFRILKLDILKEQFKLRWLFATLKYLFYGRYIDIQSNIRRKKLPRTNQGSNLLEGSFSNRDNVKAPIQFRRES